MALTGRALPIYSNTQQVIRHYIASRVGDLISGQCGIAGATTTKNYCTFLWQPDDYYNENFYEVYVYAGTNIGVTKRVTDWVLSTFLLTVHSAYSAACDATSYAELHRIFDTDDYNKAINLAIGFLAPLYLIDLKDETIVLTRTAKANDATSYIYETEYALPTSFLYIHKITLEHGVSGNRLNSAITTDFVADETVTGGTSGATGLVSYNASDDTYITVREITGAFVVGDTLSGSTAGVGGAVTSIDSITAGDGTYSDVVDDEDWDIIGAYSAKIKLSSAVSSKVDRHIRIEGQGTQAKLSADTDICYLPADWIVSRAITSLPYSKIESVNLAETFKVAERQTSLIPHNYPHPRSKSIVE